MEIKDLNRRILELLDAWDKGGIDEREVRESAEQIEFAWDLPEPIDPFDSYATAREVLSHLSILPHEMITRADIPAIRTFLTSPRDQYEQAWESWSRYWDGVDYDQRRTELANHPFYRPYLT